MTKLCIRKDKYGEENIVLGNDIDMSGSASSIPYNLNATIDGNGYYQFYRGKRFFAGILWTGTNGQFKQGLFWDILAGGTIKNIAFTDVTAYFAGNCGVLTIKNLRRLKTCIWKWS
ncbi:MAG: hypothetical protein ACLRSW_09360 [Christensenellaceae bacterium]